MFVARASAAWRTRSSNSERTVRAVSTPTIPANPQRITKVAAAEPLARRQRIGSQLSRSLARLCAEDVPGATDRMQEPRLALGLELAAQVGDEDLDRVGHRER